MEASQPLDLPLEIGFGRGRGRVLDRGCGNPRNRERFWVERKVFVVEREGERERAVWDSVRTPLGAGLRQGEGKGGKRRRESVV